MFFHMYSSCTASVGPIIVGKSGSNSFPQWCEKAVFDSDVTNLEWLKQEVQFKCQLFNPHFLLQLTASAVSRGAICLPVFGAMVHLKLRFKAFCCYSWANCCSTFRTEIIEYQHSEDPPSRRQPAVQYHSSRILSCFIFCLFVFFFK